VHTGAGRGQRVAVVVVVAVVLALVGSVAPVEDAPSGGIGEVDGVSADASLSVTVDDGLDDEELDAVVARAMARIEVIRDLDYGDPVDVTVISRETYRERRDREVSNAERTWTNLRWEALFVVGQDRDATAVLDEAFGGGVQGYYDPDEKRIVIVSSAEPTVDTETLVHELVHALQDQRFGLGTLTTTTDAEQAYESVIEGEAELVPDVYLDRCGDEWSCVRLDDDPGATDVPRGLRTWLLFPYVEGREFVAAIRDRGGWEAVDRLHRQVPNSTAGVIDPDRYPAGEREPVSVPDASTGGWTRLDRPGGDGTGDTLGAAGVHAMLVHSEAVDTEGSFECPLSSAWTGDRLVPYQRGDRHGYVWETAWETTDDAAQFAFVYRELVREHGGVATGDDLFVVADGPFEGAFRVTREETTVRVVRGPTVESLDGIHG
jgi:hypothetical protein